MNIQTPGSTFLHQQIPGLIPSPVTSRTQDFFNLHPINIIIKKFCRPEIIAGPSSGEMAMLECVGRLYRWDPVTRKATDPLEISAFQPLLVGRNRKLCQFVFDDACVSNQHLRVYTVVYDFENPLKVPPLVYAQDISTNGTFWNGQRINRKNGGAVLLSDGDILRLSSSSFLEFRSEYQSDRPLDHSQRKEIQEFANEYLITDRILGEGGFGQVRMAVNLNTASQVACKIVSIRTLKQIDTIRDNHGTSLLELQKREVTILQKLSHPNIIGVEKVFMMESSLYIFEDLITAGDLFTFIESNHGDITDFEAASVTQQILIAVDYLHDNNIVHRDLKPENILMTSHEAKRRVVLADFGCAQSVASGVERMSTKVGTWDYTAPEVHKELKTGYTKSVDLWSVGCIAVVLLIGAPPFPFSASGSVECTGPGDMNEVFMNTKWNEASSMAQDFVLSLLVLDDSKRLTAKQALQHRWFLNEQYHSKLIQLYDEAIRDWIPRNGNAPFKLKKCHRSAHKDIGLTFGTRSSLSKDQSAKSVQKQVVLESKGKTNASKAFIAETELRDKICATQSTTTSPDNRRSYSPQAWKMTPCGGQLAPLSSKPNVTQNDTKVSMSKIPKFNPTKEQRSWAYTSQKLRNRIHSPSDMSPVTFAGTKRAFEETFSQCPEKDEVFEEIENKFTGKIQRISYQEK